MGCGVFGHLLKSAEAVPYPLTRFLPLRDLLLGGGFVNRQENRRCQTN